MKEKIKSIYGEDCKDIKWTKKYKAGYILQREGISHESTKKLTYLTVAYNLDGDYIGDSKMAHFICVKNLIVPEKANQEHKVCSIGYCKSKRVYFGWSHRAIRGFKIGDTVKKGDDAYQPINKKDFLEECVHFWKDKHHLETKSKFVKGGVEISWTYNDKIQNENLRGTEGNIFCRFPDKFGKGEWTAKTLEDCKKMAIAFAESVS